MIESKAIETLSSEVGDTICDYGGATSHNF